MKTCQNRNCGCQFDPWRERQRYCSQNCADETRRKVDAEAIWRLAVTGETKAEMSRQLGVSYATVRRAIAEYGLEKTWREQRYA